MTLFSSRVEGMRVAVKEKKGKKKSLEVECIGLQSELETLNRKEEEIKMKRKTIAEKREKNLVLKKKANTERDFESVGKNENSKQLD